MRDQVTARPWPVLDRTDRHRGQRGRRAHERARVAHGPALSELASAGVRQVSTGSALAACAYRALTDAAHELLNQGTSHFAGHRITRHALETAFS